MRRRRGAIYSSAIKQLAPERTRQMHQLTVLPVFWHAGTISRAEIEKSYKISRRVEAEERGLDSAIMVFTSTQQEVDEQWGLYEG